MLYLDYAATTPPYPEVVKTIMEVMTNHYGNPSSLHRFGMEAERLVQKAKEVIGSILQVQPSSIIFTSGGTESNNLAIKGTAYQYQNRGRHLITTELEHASVSGPFAQLEGEGFQVTYLPVDGTGQVNLEELHKAITPETILVSVMHVNNEMGRIQPIADIGRMLEKYPTILSMLTRYRGWESCRFSRRRWASTCSVLRPINSAGLKVPDFCTAVPESG
nr:aminotransferase class V-fold PLP-dependent enzyme [Paenibacillus larvae]